MRALWLLLALLIAVPGSAEDRWPSGGGGGASLNVPTDTNRDGRADYILVGDYDGDGTLEMADLQAAHNALRVSTYEGTSKPAITARKGANCSGGTGNCFILASGSVSEFAVGDPILVTGFPIYSTGRAVLGVTAGGGCGVGTGGDCFSGTGTPDLSTLFAVGEVIYPFGFLEDNQGDAPQFGYTVTAVDADEVEVSCNGIAAGSPGCLDAEAERPGRWLISFGVNGLYTIASIPSATQIKVTETLPKEETSAPVDGSGNPFTKIQDARPITIDIAEGSYAAPAALPTGHLRSVLETESFTTWRCKSRNTVLNGNGDALDAAVFSGRHAHNPGYTRNVRVENCKLNGGWLAGGATASLAMGFQLQGFLDSEIVGTEVTDTGHTGYYTSNSWNLGIRDFRGTRLGNPRGLGGVTTQAGVYIFATQIGSAPGFAYHVHLTNGEIEDSASAYNFRRNAVTDEIWGPIWTNVSARNSRANCAFIRGVYRMVADTVTCENTTSFALVNGCGAWGTDCDVRESTFRNITITGGVHASTSPLQIGDYHSKNTFENISISRSSGNIACAVLQQPTRETTIRNLTIDGCAGEGLQITGASAGAEFLAGENHWTIENVVIKSTDDADPFATNRNGFQATVAVANSTFRNWRIEGTTGNAMLFNAQPCRGCLFDGITATQMQPRFIGRGTETWANGIVCNASTENYWLLTTSASGTSDCTFSPDSGGGTTNACYCDGAGTWVDMTVSGANQDALNFTGGFANSTLRNVRIKGCRNSDAINITGVATDNVFQNIHVDDGGQWAGALAASCVDGLVSDANASNANNYVQGLTCRGIAGQCFAWDGGAEPTGADADGQYDDFTFDSQFPVVAAPNDECTPGQVFQRAGGGAGTSLYVCESASGPPVGK